MKVLGLTMRGIRKYELKEILTNKIKNNNPIVYDNLREGHNFLLNDNFILGYRNIPNCDNNAVLVYILRDDNRVNDGIYIRKKIRIIKAYIDKYLKDKIIFSYVRTDRKEALKLNDYLFNYKIIEPIKLEDNNLYIFYRNKL